MVKRLKILDNKGMMVYLSQDSCLERDAIRFYDALIGLQKTMGCELKKVEENDRQFDRFVGQTYIKSMTHRNDGRTVMILGKDHHGTAGQGYFDIDPNPYQNKTGKGFGDLVRWGHLGDSIDNGILLVDFELGADQSAGAARTPQEVQQLLRFLSNYHFDPSKQVYLTKSVSISEPEYGAAVRSMGVKTLGDWIEHKFSKVNVPIENRNKKASTKRRNPKTVKRQSPQFAGGHSRGGSLRTSSWW